MRNEELLIKVVAGIRDLLTDSPDDNIVDLDNIVSRCNHALIAVGEEVMPGKTLTLPDLPVLNFAQESVNVDPSKFFFSVHYEEDPHLRADEGRTLEETRRCRRDRQRHNLHRLLNFLPKILVCVENVITYEDVWTGPAAHSQENILELMAADATELYIDLGGSLHPKEEEA